MDKEESRTGKPVKRARIDLDDNRLHFCPICKSRMAISGSSTYVCGGCGHEEPNDYTKICEYIQTFGPSSPYVISKATGVPEDIVTEMIKQEKLEIIDGPKYVKCEMCGAPIPIGRLCPRCMRLSMAGLTWQDEPEQKNERWRYIHTDADSERRRKR